jgi:hypothetical protein
VRFCFAVMDDKCILPSGVKKYIKELKTIAKAVELW